MPIDDDDDNYTNALEFVTNLPENMRACRGGRNHDFLGGEQVFGDESNGIVHIETRCGRGCSVIKVEDFDPVRGYYVKDPHYKYPDPRYLIKSKEMGSINRTDLAAASRIVNYYGSRGRSLPQKVRRPRKRRNR